jgi:hypothetical protein
VIEAELQKRLTKAVPFLRGRLTQDLGLRYAPEIRFYKDNTVEIFDQFRDQAKQYLKETQKDSMESVGGGLGAPSEAIELLRRIQTMKRMDKFQR